MQTMNIMIMLMIILVMMPLSEKLITLGSLLLVSALMVTLMIAKIFNSWFAFILFLIYITGLLVLFSYMLAMSPNLQQLKLSATLTILMMLGFMAKNLTNLVNLPMIEVDFEWKVLMMYSSMNSAVYWAMAIILLVALIMVVSICFKSPSPLRSFFK